MPKRTSKTGSELFIVDNSDDDWKVLRYLHDWCQLSKAIDVATGYFEIGGLLALKDEWQKVDDLRVLMGDEVSQRTKAAFNKGLERVKSRLDDSLEKEKLQNDFLTGVPAIVEAIRSGKIRCRVYRKDKFHAKAYITHARQEVIGSFALVGSSNLTYPGITENIELNVQISGPPVRVLQEWYEEHWDEAEDVTEEMLRVIERHTREYSPFEVYVRALHEFCRGHQLTANEWEKADPASGGSRMYDVLDFYQQEGYHALMQIARQYGGAFLCDGVGLGKTFIGLMTIERLVIHEGKRVVLFVPKTARADVWERALREYLPHVGGTGAGDFSSLVIFNHTDLGRGGDFPHRFERVKELADAIVIDEAHHFRNPGRAGEDGGPPSRYRRLLDLVDGPRGAKEVYLLTATPINNSLHDFRNMAQLFTGQVDNYFANSLGIHSLRRHFVDMERELLKTAAGAVSPSETNMVEAERVLAADRVFRELVVQRSRAYVRKSQEQQGASVDKNVFDIKQGVAVCIAARGGPELGVMHADLWGGRGDKYSWLAGHSTQDTAFQTLAPDSPFYFFDPQNLDFRAEYEQGWKITEIMPSNTTGFVTARDHFVIGFSESELLERMSDFANRSRSDAEIRSRYFVGKGSNKYEDGDSRGWRLPEARKRVQRDTDWESRVVDCLYRPFDARKIYWCEWMVDWPRPEVIRRWKKSPGRGTPCGLIRHKGPGSAACAKPCGTSTSAGIKSVRSGSRTARGERCPRTTSSTTRK